MKWLDQVQAELQRITPDGNPGRTRTIARRAAGIALQHHYADAKKDFLQLLQQALNDSSLPSEVHNAIQRLTTRLDQNFSSPSVNPVNDASIVITFVQQKTP